MKIVLVMLACIWFFCSDNLLALASNCQEPEQAGQAIAKTHQVESNVKPSGLPESNPNAVAGNSPALELLFEDDFAVDSRGSYQIMGPEASIAWNPGAIELRKGGCIAREIIPCGWIEIEADLRLTVPDESKPHSELRLFLESSAATPCFFSWTQDWGSGQVESKLAIFDVSESQDETNSSELIRELRFPRSMPQGRWRISYRYGLWSIESADGLIRLTGYVENGVAPVTLVKLAEFGATSISALRVAGNRRFGAPLTPAQEELLAQADEAYEEGQAAYSGGDLARALEAAAEDLRLREQAVGKSHPDYAFSLGNLANLYQAKADYASAAPLYLEALAISEQILGKQHPDYVQGLNSLALLYDEMADFDRAEPLYLEALAISEQVLGKQHPEYATVLNNLAALFYAKGDYAHAEPLLVEALALLEQASGKQHESYALGLNNLALLYLEMGDHARAESQLVEALAIRERILGKRNPGYASSLNNLAELYRNKGDYTRAEPLYLEALAIKAEVMGKGNPDYALGLNNLALLYEAMRDYGRAKPLLVEALAINEQVLGKWNASYASTLNNLASLFYHIGDYAQAERLFVETLAIREQILGKSHPGYAISLNNLAELYREMGDYVRAEPLYVEALAIKRNSLGKDHADYSQGLNKLAFLYCLMRDYKRAEPLCRESLAITEQALGKSHPDYARNLSGLAVIYQAMDDHTRAESLYLEALAINEQGLGRRHPDYATTLSNLAEVYVSMGDYSRAEPMFLEALEIDEQVLGKRHPDYAASLNNLAYLYHLKGEYSRAHPLMVEALGHSLQNLELASVVQGEAQQLVMAQQQRYYLDHCLVLATRWPEARGSARDGIWKTKGAILLRQRAARQLAQTGGERLRRLMLDLQHTTNQLAALSGTAPNEVNRLKDWREQLTRLTLERERLERELSAESSDFRRSVRQAAAEPEEISAKLPADCALVDLLEYWHWEPKAGEPGKKESQRRYLGFITRANQPAGLVEFGSAEAINDVVALGQQTRWASGDGKTESAGEQLRRLVWEPLQPHLAGVNKLLISPDSSLSMVPWGALPGEKPGTYLIEQYSFAVIPVPQMLASFLEPESAAELIGEPAMLLVGDVDFDAQPAPGVQASGDLQPQFPGDETSRLANTRAEQLARVTEFRTGVGPGAREAPFARLPGTAAEVDSIEQLYRRRFAGCEPTSLRQAEASVAAFCQLAPRHRYVHVASHGFFADPEVRAVTTPDSSERPRLNGSSTERPQFQGMSPGLLSGLVFAGANLPRDPANPDHGILTALHAGELGLNGVELLVLSACDTSRGRVAGGEGVLGLQRAFQVAGARTTVTSLWAVDDQATQELMSGFYANKWDKGMGTLEALRATQLDMLRKLRAENTARFGNRGGKDEPGAEPTATDPASSLTLWAAWVLSGDWR